MKILVVSDCESRYLWDYFTPDKLDGVDLILSCGDVKPQYLSFLATFATARCCMSTATTTTATARTRLLGASVWTGSCTSIRGCAFWAWGAPCGISRETTSTPSGRWPCGPCAWPQDHAQKGL